MESKTLLNQLQPGSTCIIDSPQSVQDVFGVQFPAGATSGEVTIPNNVTLIFVGGYITCSIPCNIIGLNTKILAPIGQIFGENITVSGSWAIDRAYPQWFGCVTYTTTKNYQISNNSLYDAGVSINKAIAMKQMGEVFLPKGFYIIKTPIDLTDGIQLVGEAGMDSDFSATVLQSCKTDDTTAISDDSAKYIIYVNEDPVTHNKHTSGGFLAGQITAIKNLTLRNYLENTSEPLPLHPTLNYLQKHTTAFYGGIHALETVRIENVRFRDFRKAIEFGENYYDCKLVRNCDYVCCSSLYSRIKELMDDNYPWVYAFNMNWLGDGCLFEHNAVHDGTYNKGVRLNNCMGGRVNCNIINADISIEYSNSVTFSNNHIEYGHQLSIDCSCVNVRDNYFHVASGPSLSITGNEFNDRSVVELTNNHFTFRDFGGQINQEHYSEYLNNVMNASEYDVQIDRHCIVKIRNMYRYWTTHGLGSKIYPFGIKILKKLYGQDGINYSPFDEFNDFSYKLSKESCISVGFGIDKTFTIHTPNQAVSTDKQKNNGVIWLGADGLYEYYYQIIWDKERNIIATFNGNQLHELLTYGDPLNFIQNQAGAALLSFSTFNDNDVNNYEFMIRLYRHRSADAANVWQRVDVPVTGTQTLYDNGISVCGYKWENLTENILQTLPFYSDNDMDRITYQGDSIMCRKPTKNTIVANRVAFKPGDILVNTNPSTTWTIVTIK